MAEEKIFTIPLRDAFVKSRTHRAEDASKLVKKFLIKHMKSENVKVGKSINEELWKRGIQRPPRKIRIHAVKEADNVYSELLGIDIKTPSKEEIKKKQEKEKQKREKIKEERKERKKMSLQEEIEEDKQFETQEAAPAKVKEAPKEEAKKEEAKKETSVKEKTEQKK